MGLELDKGLYAPLIIEDPKDPVDIDVDVTLMIDDWLDGYGLTQGQVLAGLRESGGHSGHDMNSGWGMGAMMGGSGSALKHHISNRTYHHTRIREDTIRQYVANRFRHRPTRIGYQQVG